MKNLVRYTFVLLVGAIFGTATVFAQQQQMPPQPEPLSPEEVTDEQLEMISNVTQAGQSIQEEADKKMRNVIEEVGMEYSRFQEIVMAQQNPQTAGQNEITDEEQQTLKQIQPDLMKINQQAQQQYIAKIEEEGLSIQEFQQIAQAIQAHPEVAKRFEKINNSNSEGEDG